MTTPRDSDAPLDRDAPTERSMTAGSHDAPGGSAAAAPTALGQLGRFVLLDSRGAGGMGIVFAAYDPELDRKVALKLLHPGRGAHFDGHVALMREAQAMARVAHPNVVTVYEVGLVGEQPFVAMELIDGPSLASWLQAQPRSWRAIVAMFLDAGRGLAAVHAAGLVHRDVKPGNILIGRDGRARLGDFGLANSHDAAASAAGTPAYMAPEQRAGSALDARADQFAFCVALWEALYGARPFATTSAAREAEPLRVPRGEVPGWVGAIALRGLARDPAERWPSMSALLAALARDPAIARRRIAFGGALVGLAAISTWGVTRYQATDDPCAGGDDGMVGAWDAPRQAEVQTAFTATALPYASATWDRVDHALGRYAGAWLAMRREACRATRVEGRQSDTLMDLRMACLDRARDRLAAVTTRWAGGVDATALEKATHAIDDLAPLAACADATALGARAPLPNDPAIVAAIGKVRVRVDDAAALRAVGKIAEARTAAEAARAEAMRTGWSQVEAEAAFEVGATLSTLGVPEAETALVETAHLAGAAHDDFLAADAMIRALETISTDQNEGARALQLAPVVEVLVARAGDGLDLRGNLDASRSDAFAALGRYDEAEAAMLAARRELVAVSPENSAMVAVIAGLAQIANAQGHLDRAIALGEEALAMEIRLDGQEHPRVASILHNLALSAESAGDLPRARAYLTRAIAIKERAFGPDAVVVAGSLNNLGNVATEQGRLDEAEPLFTRALAIRERALGPASPLVAMTLASLAEVKRQQHKLDEALALATRSRDIRVAAFGPDHPTVATSLDTMAYILKDQGDVAGARALFERKLAIDTKALGAGHPRTLSVFVALGKLLAEAGDCRGAEAQFARAIAGLAAAAPDSLGNAEALAGLGRCQVSLGKPRDAITTITRAIAIADKAAGAPADRGAMRAVLANAEWAAGEHPEAMATARAAETELLAAGDLGKSELATVRSWIAQRP